MKSLHLMAVASLALGSLASAQEALKGAATSPEAKAETSQGTAASNAADWLRGKWVFDGDYTTKKYTEGKQPEGVEGLGQALVVPQLLAKLDGSHITFTDKELRMTTKDGNGKAFAYEFLEAPDANTLSLKQADGEITTYHRDGERFWIASTGSVKVPFYFKRVR